MSTLSVPVSKQLDDFIDEMIANNKAANKADVVRRALVEFQQNQLLADIREAQDDIKMGRVYQGHLDELTEGLI